MLAVALNGDNRLTIVERDVAGGNMTRILGSLDIDVGGRGPGMVTCAVWDQDDENQAWKGNSSLATGTSTATPSKTLVPPTPTDKPAVSTGGDLSDEGLISALSASLASATSENPDAAGATLSAIEIMESMISLAASATALEGIMASLTHSNPSATSIAAGVLESMIALSSSMAVLSDDLESIITKNPASTTQVSGSTLTTGAVPSTTPPTIPASMTSGSAASATGAITTPTPFQTGMIGNCTKFHLVVSGDTCSSIATAAGISLSDFYIWNPAVGTSCATLFAENNVCIGVGSYN
jgi:hypothetical protein